jgi:hypothetical protein
MYQFRWRLIFLFTVNASNMSVAYFFEHLLNDAVAVYAHRGSGMIFVCLLLFSHAPTTKNQKGRGEIFDSISHGHIIGNFVEKSISFCLLDQKIRNFYHSCLER